MSAPARGSVVTIDPQTPPLGQSRHARPDRLGHLHDFHHIPPDDLRRGHADDRGRGAVEGQDCASSSVVTRPLNRLLMTYR